MGTLFFGVGILIFMIFIIMIIIYAVISDYLIPKILVAILGIVFILIGLKLGVNI
jgi:hypothetical protein